MKFPKQLKDIMYELLREPTLEKLREFLHSQTVMIRALAQD